jgi:hypothetical protein
MPLLHIRISNNDEYINIPKAISAQALTFKRAVIVKDVISPAPPDPYAGALSIEVAFFAGYEIVSNQTRNSLLVPLDNQARINDRRFEFNFASESIRNSFKVKTFNSDTVTPAPFGGAGQVLYVDLYFQYFSYD